ncbi:LysR family transcriptional regulator [Neorhizobium sp. DAR64860/K0K1]|uniref:LysR family transcriptional regulator n=1 Tax=Neorhizobium sp. DAR64860/K0K1 TaxID=3421955 RepID=UPI003D266006
MPNEGFDDMLAFVAVARSGSFRQAAQQLGRDASVISRRIGQLERRLGVRLLVRTTRSVTLTEAGSHYFQRLRHAIDELDLATREVSGFAADPQGTLKISLPVTFGRLVVAPLLPQFLRQYPQIKIEAQFQDRTVDIVEEGFDVVIRIGVLRGSTLMAKRLGSFWSILVASPVYVAERGSPRTPTELESHACLGFTRHPDWPSWILEREGKQTPVRPEGPMVADSSEFILYAALDHTGIALLPYWMVTRHLAEGSLVPVLPEWRSIREINIFAVMPPGTLMPAKTRLFVDETAKWLRNGDVWPIPDALIEST